MLMERFSVPAGQTYVLQTGSLAYGEMLVGTFEIAGGRDVDFELRDPHGQVVERQTLAIGSTSFAVRIIAPGPYLLRFGNPRARLRRRDVTLRLQGYAVVQRIEGQG